MLFPLQSAENYTGASQTPRRIQLHKGTPRAVRPIQGQSMMLEEAILCDQLFWWHHSSSSRQRAKLLVARATIPIQATIIKRIRKIFLGAYTGTVLDTTTG